MRVVWSQMIFTITNAVSLPLYLLIMVVCVKEWKRSHAQRSFYSLMISQGIVDILVMTNFFIFVTLRTSQLFNDFYWSYQRYYVPKWCFNQAYISVFFRCCGVLFISFQRYISLCRSSWRIEQIINTSHRWILPILQWLIPAAYSVPLLILSEATFDTSETLEVIAHQSDITLATSMAITFVSVTFIGCAFCYGAILEFLMRNRLDCSEAIRRERRLYIQMLGLFVAFALIFVYNILQFTFSLYTNEGPILVMRTIFPVISCFFSYVNSWMTLFLNHDIRRKILILLGYRSKQIQISVIMIPMWSQGIFISINAVSLPLHLTIIIVCVKEWKHNHLQKAFYLLLISQGAVDIVVMVNYFLFWTLRVAQLFSDFYWNYQDYYIATWAFNQTYISVFIRCFGVLLIAFQRYISLCKNGSRIEQIINISHRWALPILQWTIPSIYSIPLLLLSNANFFSEENLEVIVEKQSISLATSMAVLFVTATFIVCSIFYGAILRFLVKNRYNSNTAIKRECRLYTQMLGLFVGFVLLLIYNIMQFIFSLRSNDGPIFTMRIVFPMVSCFFSYVNAWMTLFLNDDIRGKILILLGVREQKLQSSVHMSTSIKMLPSRDTRRF